MSKKILILNGSTRAKSNTAALVEAFTSGAEGAGHSVKNFNVSKMNIHGCLGCLGGGKNPDSPCVQKDDMEKIYPAFKEADIIVFASPLYFWSVTAQLKTAMDRTFALVEGAQNSQIKNNKGCVMLIAAADSNKENFASVLCLYENMLEYMGWKDHGHIFAGGVMHIGDIKDKPEIEDARRLGASI